MNTSCFPTHQRQHARHSLVSRDRRNYGMHVHTRRTNDNITRYSSRHGRRKGSHRSQHNSTTAPSTNGDQTAILKRHVRKKKNSEVTSYVPFVEDLRGLLEAREASAVPMGSTPPEQLRQLGGQELGFYRRNRGASRAAGSGKGTAKKTAIQQTNSPKGVRQTTDEGKQKRRVVRSRACVRTRQRRDPTERPQTNSPKSVRQTTGEGEQKT